MRRSLFFLLVAGLLAVHPAGAQPTALVGPTALNPADSTVIEDATVLLDGNRIAAVGPSGEVEVPVDATVHEMPDRYVMPGLVDGHVHFFQSGGLYTRPDVIDLRAERPYSEELRRIKKRLPDTFRRYLRSGVTSVVDVGGPMWTLDVRARADTAARAPTVATAGPLISSVERPSLDEGDPPILQITTPEAARKEVRDHIMAGVDLIKIWYIVGGDETPADYRPVVEATVDEAHNAGTRVAVHATELETARAAVEAGADILVHSVSDQPVDDAFVRLLQENGVLYTPTLMVSERYRETFAQQLDLTTAEHHIGHPDVIGSLFDLRTLPDSLMPAGLRQRIEQAPTVASDTTAMRNLTRLHDAGVSIAAGTDAGNIGTPHGPALFREFELMRTAGLAPQEILATATAGGARLLGRDDLGRLESGMQADLVVLDENPFADITNVSSIHRIVKEGRVYPPTQLIARTPTAVVQQGANAFNAHDLGGFLDAFAPDLEVYAHPDSLIMEGRSALREQYASTFQTANQLRVEVHHTAPIGTTVALHETIRGMPETEPLEQVVLYRVTEGAIDRVWLVQEE
ncbi:amidohydrolase family protein [Salinibacter altiplanensis]|uniref:amidohydrolase family protein n=1 Tax=Salinibacter altiplanensis TaxID=1803181 RepID=UPI000C9F2387|nr:amidohydrolase family protein [Salinibacter altiplanensis]